jgi:steroid delta-isomerase-like uncharacterized protein
VATAENKATVRAWFKAFNDRDMAAEEAARAPDYVAHVSGAPVPLDGAGWRSFVGSFFTGFPDFRLEIEDMLAEEDRVAVRWTFHGTHTGEFLSIAPTGKPVTMSAVEVNRVVGGRVAEHWVVLDQLGVLRQLGVM